MKSITKLFQEAFEKKRKRNWEKIYVLVDLHDTIVHGVYDKEQDFKFISADCIEVLKQMTERKDICLILWTSTYIKELLKFSKFVENEGIDFDWFNKNPEELSTKYADFSHKFYFNVIIDDKAGFEPSDWGELRENLHLIR